MELELIKRCLKEDRRAQETFYKICYTRFIGTANRYASSKEQAVFFFNLGFVKLLLNLNQYNTENPFDYWAKRVVINTILNELKKEKREQEKVLITDDWNSLSINHHDEAYEEELKAKMDLIKEKVQYLPPMTKNVFNLYAIDGYKHHEIASMLDINENTSMWHYSDAKKRIRKLLEINQVADGRAH